MDRKYRFVLSTLIIFSFLFIISTFVNRLEEPSIISIRVVEYGFPYLWLKIITQRIPPPQTQYFVSIAELVYDVIIYLAISLIVSFFITRTPKENNPLKVNIGVRLFVVFLVAYIARLGSCAVHEVLGHGLWAWIFGAKTIVYSISWLGYGVTIWEPPLSYHATSVIVAGGIINSSIIGWGFLLFLYSTRKKGKRFLVRIPVFLLGSWLAITQASYLLIGGLTGYGDIGKMHHMFNIPYYTFDIIGVILFLISFIVISTLFLSELSWLFPEFGKRALLSEFWLIVPILLITFNISPDRGTPSELSPILLFISFLPTIVSIFAFKPFKKIAFPSA